MSTAKQRAANRANAQKSSGPVSAAGKETVSQNSRKHGLCGAFTVIKGENQADYDSLLERFMRVEQPADDVERELVAKMARHTWMSERAVRLQEAHFLVQPLSEDDQQNGTDTIHVLKGLELYLRYQTTHDRAYQRASAELARRRKDRQLFERRFVSQKQAEAEEKRREEKHVCQIERTKTALAIGQVKLERDQTKALLDQVEAEKQIDTRSAARTGKIAA